MIKHFHVTVLFSNNFHSKTKYTLTAFTMDKLRFDYTMFGLRAIWLYKMTWKVTERERGMESERDRNWYPWNVIQSFYVHLQTASLWLDIITVDHCFHAKTCNSFHKLWTTNFRCSFAMYRVLMLRIAKWSKPWIFVCV